MKKINKIIIFICIIVAFSLVTYGLVNKPVMDCDMYIHSTCIPFKCHFNCLSLISIFFGSILILVSIIIIMKQNSK